MVSGAVHWLEDAPEIASWPKYGHKRTAPRFGQKTVGWSFLKSHAVPIHVTDLHILHVIRIDNLTWEAGHELATLMSIGSVSFKTDQLTTFMQPKLDRDDSTRVVEALSLGEWFHNRTPEAVVLPLPDWQFRPARLSGRKLSREERQQLLTWKGLASATNTIQLKSILRRPEFVLFVDEHPAINFNIDTTQESPSQPRKIGPFCAFFCDYLLTPVLKKLRASLLAFYGGGIFLTGIGFIWVILELGRVLTGSSSALSGTEALIATVGMGGLLLELIFGFLADVKRGSDTCTLSQKNLSK